MARRKKNSKLSNKKLIYAVISLLFVLMIYILPKVSDKFGKYFDFYDDPKNDLPKNGEISVHYIDVGQGDSTLILTPEGKSMLIDTGTPDSRSLLLEYLSEHGVKELEYLVLTHPHSDHIGGAAALLGEIAVKNIIMPDATTTTSTFENLLKKIDSLGNEIIVAEHGKTYSFSDISFEILGPTKDYGQTLNNQSIVLRLDYGRTSFLFMGDAETVAEADMMDLFPISDFKADVIKLGHHGSSTSTSEEFLAAVSPDFAVVSCGKNNDYGHPHRETISVLEKNNIEILRTDTMGSIVFTSDGERVTDPSDS